MIFKEELIRFSSQQKRQVNGKICSELLRSQETSELIAGSAPEEMPSQVQS